MQLLNDLADDLHNSDVSRSLPSGRTDRMDLPAPEFLKANMAMLKRCRLQLVHWHHPVNLSLPSDMRSPRASSSTFLSIAGESRANEANRVIPHALSGIGDVARLIAIDFSRRRGGAAGDGGRVMSVMAGCLDLRKLAFDSTGGHFARAGIQLRALAQWASQSVARVDMRRRARGDHPSCSPAPR